MQINTILPIGISQCDLPRVYHRNRYSSNCNLALPCRFNQFGINPGTLHGWPIQVTYKWSSVYVDLLKLPQGYGLNSGFRQLIQDEPRSINKRQPAFFANIIHVSRGVFHELYSLAPPIFR